MARHRNMPSGTLVNPYIIGSNYIYDDWRKIWKWANDVNVGSWFPVGGYRPYMKDCWDQLNPGPPYMVGGPLDIRERNSHYYTVSNSGTYISRNGWYKYEGGFVSGVNLETVANGCGFPTTTESSDRWTGDSSQYGATGWNRFRPGRPGADLGVFLGEARDIPHMLQGTAKSFRDAWKALGGNSRGISKSAANTWLNTQFGWLPFLSDMRKFYKTWQNLDKSINYLKRHNGRWVKRGGAVLSDSTSTVLADDKTHTGHHPVLNSMYYANPLVTGSHTVALVESTYAWFEGAFRYYIPDIGSVQWNRKAVRLLFGGGINPSLLWELTPWSWLIDWFSNAGDVFSNLDNNLAENLAAKYAFVMCTITREIINRSFHEPTGSASWSLAINRKSRTAASPFGFSLSDSDLTTRQWSILGALGISRIH